MEAASPDARGNEDSAKRRQSLDLDDLESNDDPADSPDGDYSTRMEDILSDSEEGNDEGKAALKNSGLDSDNDDSDSDVFIYDGEGADKTEGGYRAQMREVLGLDEEEDEFEEREVEQVLTPPPGAETASPNMNGHTLVLVRVRHGRLACSSVLTATLDHS